MVAELRRASGPGCVLLLLVELHRYLALDLLRNAGDTWVIAQAFALKWPQFEIYYLEYIGLIPRLQQVVAAAAAAGLVDTVPGVNGKIKVPMLEMLVAPERQLANYKMLFERMLKELPSIDPTQAARFNLLAFDGQLNSFLQRANAAPETGKWGFMGTFVGFLDGMARWRKEAASSPVKGAGFPAPAPAGAMGMLSTLLSPGQSKKRKQRDEDADADEHADGGSPSKRKRAVIGRRWAR
ncbi:hypothetical protein DFJ74DRAFT_87641 [Hyaloraphidium curvatum]|nr:hypothetical protein DFJ74DRAFT_87641 [Hyaloraphidium curvatum]